MSVIESQVGMSDLIPCNELCGGNYAKYSFGQTESEVTVTVPVPPGTTSKQVTVQISSSSLSVGIKGDEPTISGKLFRAVKDSESTWCIQDRREVVVTLVKLNPKFEEWWPSVVDGERQIDMKTLNPPPVRIGDLDDGTRATVAKMMYEQQQKRLGKEPSGVPYPPS